MATSAPREDPAYIVTTDPDGYGFSLTRYRGESTIELMVEDQVNCPVGQSQLKATLYRDKLVVTVEENAVARCGIPTDYVVTFSAGDDVLVEMDDALRVICDGIAEYGRQC
jgi:hypothetical protein